MPKREIDRDTELSGRTYIRHKLLKVFDTIDKAVIDQRGRSDDIMDFWDAYNCKLGERQFYSGNSKIFVPIIKTAVKARKTRFVNQVFPQSGRFVEVTTTDGEIPHATMALAEHYVKRCKLRTQIVPALIANGDCEGQYTVYVGWSERKRHVARRVQNPVMVDGLEMPTEDPVDDIEEETVTDAGPDVELIHDSDLIVLPTTANSIEDAIAKGGSVTVVRRWTETKVKEMIADGTFTKDAGEPLLKNFGTKKDGIKDTGRELSKAAGLKDGGGGKYVLGYETWTKIKVEGETRLCVAYYGGHDMVLGCKLNPYWCDLCPVISIPVDKQGDVFKGRAPVADVLDMQVDANDAINEAADTAHFSAMPIIMTDPEKNPRVGTMVLGLAAIWETNPKDTSFAQFPPLWKDGLERVASAKNEVFQALGVNPAMIPQSTGRQQKRNQAEIANEQQVDVLTTADAVTNIEEGILTPLVQRIIMYDHQFRDRALMIRRYGEMGMRAIMEEVPPIQELERYEFRWFGVEAARNAAQIQQQIATLNVLKGIPPQMYEGYKLNAVPVITQIVENTFGPRLAPLVFEDLKKQIGIPAEMENMMLGEGFDMMVHPFDNDAEHLQVHMALMAAGDPHGVIRAHLIRHQQQMQQKAQAAQAKGLPGSPGGAGPGVAGTPRPGAQPSLPRQQMQPPGAVRQDAMAKAGSVVMPRKM